MHPGPADGLAGPGTFSAIYHFQKYFLRRPDSVVDPRGWTEARMLNQRAISSIASRCVFPIRSGPPNKWHWTEGMRAYGANRSGGRAHAGSDIYAPKGTPLYAMKDGIVLRSEYPYYARTNAIHLDFGEFEMVYGEIDPGSALVKKGDRVTKGQKIAEIGHLVGISVPSDMLHAEMYDKTQTGQISRSAATGAKTSNGRPFKRRKDLFNSGLVFNLCHQNRP